MSYRHSMEITQKHFDDDYEIVNDKDMWSFNPIKANLGHIINKYDKYNWHSFDYSDFEKQVEINKHEYGQFNGFDDYIHYFDQFTFDFVDNTDYDHNDTRYDYTNNIYMKCSEQIDDLPFKMCMR